MRIDFVKSLVANLSASEKAELGAFLKGLENDGVSDLDEARFSGGLYCPNCGGTEKVVRFGKRNGVQRYRCKDCGRIFTTLTNTVMEGTRKPISVWKKYVECMLDGLSVRKSAAICGISKNQSFIWRHKILDAMSKKNDKEAHLRGIIEADETFFRISFKGSRNLPVKPTTEASPPTSAASPKKRLALPVLSTAKESCSPSSPTLARFPWTTLKTPIAATLPKTPYSALTPKSPIASLPRITATS